MKADESYVKPTSVRGRRIGNAHYVSLLGSRHEFMNRNSQSDIAMISRPNSITSICPPGLLHDMLKNLSKPVKFFIVLAAVLVGTALLEQMVWPYVGISIFGPSWPFPPPLDFSNSAQIATPEEAAWTSMRASLAELMSPPAPFTLRKINPELDGCEEKSVDEPKLPQRCQYWTHRIYGFDGDFRQTMIDLEDKIIASGWKSEGIKDRQVKYIMEEYYDKYYRKEPPPKGFPDGYGVSSLPQPRNWVRGREKINLKYVERATAQSKHWIDQGIMRSYPSSRDVLKTHEYALIVTITWPYFRN